MIDGRTNATKSPRTLEEISALKSYFKKIYLTFPKKDHGGGYITEI